MPVVVLADNFAPSSIPRSWADNVTCTSLRQAVYAAAVAGAASSGCFGDASGPATMRGTLALAPVFPSAAAPLVAVADLELVIRTGPDAIVFDTTIALEAGVDSVDLTVTFDAPESNGPLELVLGLRNAQGAVVFIGGPMDVTPTPVGTTPPPTTVPLLYVGVGANAASVKIDEPETFVPFETEYVLTAEALDNSGAPIAGTPIGWKTLDTALVTLPDQASGRIVSRSRRGSARIVAALLTGIEDTASIVIQPNPSGLVMTGDGQRGIVGSTVTTPIQATIIGPDDLPIAGVWVRFTASDGGAVSADSVLTDAEGIASVIWMLGPTAGVQTLSAVTPTTPTVTGNVTATAVAVRAVVRWVNPVDGMWSNPLNWSDGIAPGSGDSVAIDVDGTYTVTADVPAMVRSMTFGATSGQQQLQISGQSFTASGAVEVASGTLLLSNGRLEAPAGLTVLADATLDMTHGTVDAPLDLQGTLIARAGFHAVTGAAITAASSSLQVRGAGSATSLDFDAGLTMNGTFELTNDVPSIPATVQISGGPFTIGKPARW